LTMRVTFIIPRLPAGGMHFPGDLELKKRFKPVF